jgi:hypothetical protein
VRGAFCAERRVDAGGVWHRLRRLGRAAPTRLHRGLQQLARRLHLYFFVESTPLLAEGVTYGVAVGVAVDVCDGLADGIALGVTASFYDGVGPRNPPARCASAVCVGEVPARGGKSVGASSIDASRVSDSRLL